MHTLWVVRHSSKSAIRAWSDLRQLRSSIEVIELHTQGRPLPVQCLRKRQATAFPRCPRVSVRLPHLQVVFVYRIGISPLLSVLGFSVKTIPARRSKHASHAIGDPMRTMARAEIKILNSINKYITGFGSIELLTT